MEAVKTIEVNGRKYGLRMFSPFEAFEYIYDYTHAAANGLNMRPLVLKALGQCVNEMERSLGDRGVFEAHFAQYPEDMLELGVRAQDELVRPFSRSEDATRKTGDA